MLPRARHLPGLLALILALPCALALAAPAATGGSAPLVLNTDFVSPYSRADGSGFADRLVIEAFRRIGTPVRLAQLPSERCLQNVNDGVDDGNYARIAGLASLYPDLVMVPEPLCTFPFNAFTRDPTLKVAAWADLRELEVGYVTGWKLVEQHLANRKSAHGMRDESALFAMLDKNRVAVVISSLYTGQEIIRRKGYQDMRAVMPPLTNPPMFIYLHKRHAGLVPRLAGVLRQMRREGTTERLTRAGLAGGEQ